MSGIFYIVVAVLVGLVSAYIGTKFAIAHRTPLVKDQKTDAIVNAVAVTIVSIIMGAGWLITVPVGAVCFGIYKAITKGQEVK